MHIAMSNGERTLFESFLRCTRRYVEFGAGGSTYLATALVSDWVISLDSSEEWLDRVREECLASKLPIVPSLVHAYIGETGEWGYPLNEKARNRWTDYHNMIWLNPEASRADLYLVDGRFRVACFMQIILHAHPDALIAIHDFANRPQYHVIYDVAREIAVRENLSVFVRRPDCNPIRALAILNEHALIPA